jgi:DNA polymerase III delta subunit
VSSFSQWRTSYLKKPVVKQAYWLCGSERILVEDVLDTIKKQLSPKPWNVSSLSVGEDSERAIWAEAYQHSLDNQPRIVIVRRAQKLKQQHKIIDWIAQRSLNPKTTLVLVSDDERIPKELTEEQKKNREKGQAPDYIRAFMGKGVVVECRPFTQETAKHAVAWVQERANISAGIAGHLLDRADGDLRVVRDLCAKLSVFPEAISPATVNAMLEQKPRDSFADALLALNKKEALSALELVPTAEYTRLLGFLDYRLELAGLVHDMTGRQASAGEIMKAAGPQAYLVKDLTPISKHYDLHRRLQIRQVLALADDALQSGQTEGVLEVVTHFW